MRLSPLVKTAVVILSLFSALSAHETPKYFPDGFILDLDNYLRKGDTTSHLSIVYFGQSIISATGVKNWWPDSVTQHVRNTFPKATITAANAAISGYDAACMIRDDIVQKKLVPLAPDLIIIAIYFHYEEQMEALLKQIKSALPKAMIAMVDFHYSLPKDTHWSAAGRKSEVPWEDALSYDYLPWLCNKYKVAYMDIRRPWIQYMIDFFAGADSLTNPADGIHLNDRGQWLMAQFVKQFFDLVIVDYFGPGVEVVSYTDNNVYVKYHSAAGMLPGTVTKPSSYLIDSGKVTFTQPIFDEITQTACLPLAAPLDRSVEHTLSLQKNAIREKSGNSLYNASIMAIIPASRADGWKNVDIGRVFTKGQTVGGTAANELLISGGGDLTSPMGCAWSTQTDPCAPRWRWRNECQFYAVNTVGDFSISTHVSNIDKLNDYSQAGILIRQDTKNYLTPMIALCTFRKDGGNIDFVKRVTADSIDYVVPRTKNSARWLRITRTGNVFEAFISETGSSWTSIGSTSSTIFPEVYIGLFVTGNDYGGGPYTATFSDIAVEGAPAVGVATPQLTNSTPARLFTLRGNRLLVRPADADGPIDVSLIDMRGRVVFRCTTQQQSITLPRRAPGVYTVRISEVSGNAGSGTGKYRFLIN